MRHIGKYSRRTRGARVRALCLLAAVATTAFVTGTHPIALAASQRMEGFDAVATGGDMLTLNVPAWMNGRIYSDGPVGGTVRRKVLGNSEAVSLFGISVGGARRYGRYAIAITTGAHDAMLATDCVYERTERRMGIDRVKVTQPLRPLLMLCRIDREGRMIGEIVIEAAERTTALLQPTVRVGYVEIGGTRLSIESRHRLRGAAVPTDLPVGYVLSDGANTVGAVDNTGFTKRVIALPAAGDARLAALAAGVALGVFWDPGDTDD